MERNPVIEVLQQIVDNADNVLLAWNGEEVPLSSPDVPSKRVAAYVKTKLKKVVNGEG